ncbi:hypothetical protein [Arthrobacter sp. Leaf234]|uniref:hypothetical protein n=1 Tax=Arthrobacter sp. Leaf234 TaxID=1736303 RepID=UPI000B309C70|nr:hypothetical protein [Arthrobacter sp. Leaf234]
MRWPLAGACRATHVGTPAVPDRRGLVPLWTVRCAAALIAVLLGALVWNGSGWIVLPVVVAAGAAILPSIGLTVLTLLLLVVAYAVNMPAGSPWLLVFAAGLHAVFVLDLLLVHLPLRGWISLSALRLLGVSFLRVQAVAQPLAVLALLVDDAGSSLPLVLVGVAALVAWCCWLIGRRPPQRSRR